MITFKDDPFWWAKTGDNITSGCTKIVITRKEVEHEAPEAMASSVAISLPASESMADYVATVATISPENMAFFDVNVHPPGGTGVILKMTVNGDSTQLGGTATFRFCHGTLPDIKARLSINNYCGCLTVWIAKLRSVAKMGEDIEALISV